MKASPHHAHGVAERRRLACYTVCIDEQGCVAMNLHIASQAGMEIDCAIHFVHTSSQPAEHGLAFGPRDVKKGRVSLWREPRPTLLCGVGDAATVDAEALRAWTATALRQARVEGFRSVAVHCPGFVETTMAARACAEGAVLGLYAFDKYKGRGADADEGSDTRPQDVHLLVEGAAAAAAAAWGEQLARGACLARDLANEPPNVLRPSSFAEFVSAH
ncbi:MAG: hypothetical protein OWT27_06470, partial [Firmicutes bacterium]|nr:hypothetical protein [Bacillota bacterium]